MPTNNELSNKLAKPNGEATRKLGFKPLFQRVREAEVNSVGADAGAEGDPNAKPNRIALLLDCSGSMSSFVFPPTGEATSVSKIQLLRKAVSGFITATDPADTSVALRTFPGKAYASESEAITRSARPLSSNKALLLLEAEGFTTAGGTPMAEAIRTALNEVSMTRAVLVSDGEADSPLAAIEEAKKYSEASLPIDCVHIGDSHGGEATLRAIAEATKGLYIKFADVTQFSKSFAFLAQPAFRAMLTEGDTVAKREALKQLGATEVR
jgi:hypothetical protein